MNLIFEMLETQINSRLSYSCSDLLFSIAVHSISIYVTRAELQYQIQPIYKSGTVSEEGIRPFFSSPYKCQFFCDHILN